MINQCYPAIFYSKFPIKTLTQINLNYKQLFNRSQKQKLQKVGYKHSKTCQFTYLLYLPMQQIRLAEPLVPRACITGMSPVSLSNIGSLFIAKDTNNISYAVRYGFEAVGEEYLQHADISNLAEASWQLNI